MFKHIRIRLLHRNVLEDKFATETVGLGYLQNMYYEHDVDAVTFAQHYANIISYVL